jgi:hypothetical protein
MTYQTEITNRFPLEYLKLLIGGVVSMVTNIHMTSFFLIHSFLSKR